MILPGSKNTRGDLAFLMAQGWAPALAKHLRYGGKVIGICGGFQMLGTSVDDPHGVESRLKSITGVVDSGIFADVAKMVIVAEGSSLTGARFGLKPCSAQSAGTLS